MIDKRIVAGYVIILTNEELNHQGHYYIFISRDNKYESNNVWRGVQYDILLRAVADYNYICDLLLNFHGKKFIRYILRSLWKDYPVDRVYGKFVLTKRIT